MAKREYTSRTDLVDPSVRDFDMARVYNDHELQDFHNKIQRFWADITLSDNTPSRKFDFDEMAVAFGAFTKIKHGTQTVYRAQDNNGESTRYIQLCNLMHQYEDWQRKQDWVGNKNVLALEKMAEEVPF